MSERRASMGDKVYRGDVVKFIRNNISLGTFMKRTVKTADEACWDLCDQLNYVPAIKENPEPHWIPVTERLPNRDELVLVTYKTTSKIHLCKYLDDGSENSWWSYIDDCCAWNNVILAWMPLPEPYKGVTE